MPRAEALSPSHYQGVCLDLSVPSVQHQAFKWGPEKVWLFLRVTEYHH